MQFISRNGCLTLTLIAIASTGEFLTACTNTASNSVEMQQEHDGMNHGMDVELGTADADYDLRFIDAMRLHHRGAIATSQQKEIDQMQQWRQAWYQK